MLRRFEHSQVYRPERTLLASGAALGRPFEDVFFNSADGLRLNGWFFPAQAGAPRSALAVLLCHGNGGNISHRLEMYEALLSLGLNLMAFDYRGYGRSEGRPSEEGTYLDAQAAHQWLQRKGFKEILVYGESLGGGVASELAVRTSPAGLVLQSTFTSIPDIGAELFRWLPVRRLARIRYETHRKLPGLSLPVLIMHSRADRLIGIHHAQRNFALANPPKLFCELQGGHNEPLADRAGYLAGLQRFLTFLEDPDRTAAPEGVTLPGAKSLP